VDPILNLNTVCKNTPSLNREQLELCKTHADVVASALQGAQMAVHGCKQQFAYSRWNCSSLESKNRNPLTSPLLARGELLAITLDLLASNDSSLSFSLDFLSLFSELKIETELLCRALGQQNSSSMG